MPNLFKKYIKVVKEATFVANVFKLTSGTVFAQGIYILTTPILTRIFSPSDFGVFYLYFSLVGIISSANTGRYEQAILLPEEKMDSINVLTLSLLFSFVVSIILLVVILVFKNNIAIALNSPTIENWLIIIPLAVFIQGAINSFVFWNNRVNDFNNIAKGITVRGSVLPLSSFVFGIFKFNHSGLILGHLMGKLTELLMLVKKKTIKMICNYSNWKEIYKMGKRYKKFPFFTAPSNLLNNFSLQLPVFFLTRFFDEIVVGYFSQSMRLLNIPTTALGVSVGQVYFNEASKCRDSEVKLASLTRHTYEKLFYIGFIPMAIVMVFGDLLFPFVLGKEWYEAGVYSQLLSVWLLLVFIGSPISNVIAVLEKQKIGLLFNIFILIVRILSLTIGFLILEMHTILLCFLESQVQYYGLFIHHIY